MVADINWVGLLLNISGGVLTAVFFCFSWKHSHPLSFGSYNVANSGISAATSEIGLGVSIASNLGYLYSLLAGLICLPSFLLTSTSMAVSL